MQNDRKLSTCNLWLGIEDNLGRADVQDVVNVEH